jgi:hypothetical protein
MRSKRRVVRVEESADLQLLVMIQAACSTDAIRAIVTKDFHLVYAAIATDRVLITVEERCVKHFRTISATVAAIATITVANPELMPDEVMQWLQNGAPATLSWQLGHP